MRFSLLHTLRMQHTAVLHHTLCTDQERAPRVAPVYWPARGLRTFEFGLACGFVDCTRACAPVPRTSAWQCSLTMYYEVCLAPTAHACPRIIASHTVICLRAESNRLQTPRHVPVTLQVRSSRKRPARRQNRAKTVRAGSRLAPWLEWGDFKWVGPRGHVAAVRGLRCERRRARK